MRINSDRTDRDMDGIHLHFTVRTSLSFLLLILLQTSTADICSAPLRVDFSENNVVGDVVVTINVQPGVTFSFKPLPANPNNPFSFEGNTMIATRVLDHETDDSHVANIICTETASGRMLDLIIVVIVTNLNDNPPVFSQDTYRVDVNELSPVNTFVGRFPATDLDAQTIYYTLTPESSGFKLRSPTNPDLLVDAPLDYDRIKSVPLILSAQDAPLPAANSRAPFTATTTIIVTILDVDNRPPWFQPCSKHEFGGAVICQSAGYTSTVVLNELETGVLPLKPGPLYAIDGDSGINAEITYSFLNGDAGGLFAINPNTGNISMLKEVDLLGTISLTVLAAQRTNSDRFSTTPVTISVRVKSLHRPQFQRPQYEAVVTAVGVMAMDPENKDALRILATDEDYAATGGRNPHITYSVNGSTDFSIIDSYLFMTKDLPEGTLSLQVVATDLSTEESISAQLTVEVISGLTTTSLPLSTTDSMVSTSTEESTTNNMTTEDIVSTTNPSTSESIISTTNPSMTSEDSISTTNPSLTSEDSISTSDPSLTSEGSIPTASTAHPHTVIVPSGRYGPVDLAALGVTLGVLLLICLVVITVLSLRIRKGKADWRKIFEASMFQSSLGQSGRKEGIQYTNDAFQNDEDGGSTGSGGPVAGSVMAGGVTRDFLLNDAIVKSSAPGLLRDDTSQAGSDKTDSEKEVKPILTKERRMDEGYKSVWFKEDIDPDAKEEVLIIPDSREDDSEEEDEEQSTSGREEDEDDDSQIKTPRVVFNDADLDSGLGVKMEDPAENSEDENVLTVDL